VNILLHPAPIRAAIIGLIKSWSLGSYPYRLKIGAVDRPHYGYIVYNAARLAKRLNIERISVLEFGVAGGSGLMNLEYHAREVEAIFPVKIDIYGFDTGKGLPKPVDYRDLPFHWREGFFRMDVPALQARLARAKLVLGNITDTAQRFFRDYDPAPIGAIIHDFDFYSSTAAALKLFEEDEKYFLPRIFCYFDDTIGDETPLYNDYTGQRLAINEFNQTHESQKLGLPYHLLGRRNKESWYQQIFIYHDFQHPRYNDFVSDENQQLPI